MRIVLILVSTLAVTACGQTGSLYLPEDAVETPVEIRTPAATAPAPAEEEDEKKNTQPPGS